MSKDLLITLIVGAILVALGVVNWKGNISTIHWYHRTRIHPDDVPRYGRTVGAGTMVIGLSVMAAGVLEDVFALSQAAPIVVGIGLAVGIAMITYAQFKYNGGLF